MIEMIVLAFVIAIINKLNIVPVLILPPMIPIYIAIIFYIAMYFYKPLGKYVKVLIILLTLPILYFVVAYSLYIWLAVGLILFPIGVWLNLIAVNTNQDRMPIFPTISRLTRPKAIDELADNKTHRLGNRDTKYKILCDIFDFGHNAFSVGDFLIFSAFGLVIYGLIWRLQ